MNTDQTATSTADDSSDTLAGDVKPKTRLCLKCRSPFESAGAGERVCRRCKSSATWRGGR